jgi:exonuclease I
MMTKLISGVVAVAIAMACVAPLAAHDEYRIIGTVVKITADQIDVKQVKDGKVIEIDINKQTKVTRDKKPAPMKDVKLGGSVVVEALGDTILDLLAIEIRLVPALPGTKKVQ